MTAPVEQFLRNFLRIVIAQKAASPDGHFVAEARVVADEMKRRGYPLVMLELWLSDPASADAGAVCAELQRAVDAVGT